jgi:hypothetical protein
VFESQKTAKIKPEAAMLEPLNTCADALCDAAKTTPTEQVIARKTLTC